MRIITPARLAEYAKKHSVARNALAGWQTAVEGAQWETSTDVKYTFNSVDIYVTEKLRRTLFIFNICGNQFRLICAIHFPKLGKQGKPIEGRVYIREFLTHPEYVKGQWKVQNDKD